MGVTSRAVRRAGISSIHWRRGRLVMSALLVVTMTAGLTVLDSTIAPVIASAAAPTPNNLARTASVSQSSTQSGRAASRAIDGITSGVIGANSTAQTTNSTQPWWQADLGAVRSIPEIKIWTATDTCCASALTDVSVFVSDVAFTSTNPATTRGQTGVTEYRFTGPVATRQWIQADRTGRYVRVQLNGSGTLYLSEVQIGGPFGELSSAATRTWGVDGIRPSLNTDIQSEIFAIEQVGNTIYVGGRFDRVIERRFTVTYDQPYIAAFDATTGAWINWWRPQFDGTVKAIEASPDGTRLYVGGEFTSVNGDPLAGGLVALETATGQVDTSWRADLSQLFAPAPAIVHTIDVTPSYIYVGGTFSHVATPPSFNRVNVFKAIRLSPANGQVDLNWRPNVTGGAVFGIAANDAGNRVYIVGTFSGVNGEANSGNFFVADTVTGARVPGLLAYPFNSTTARETFDVVAANGLVFTGGSQHLLTVLRESDLALVNRVHTAVAGGDIQDIELVGNRVYATCHCRGVLYDHASATNTPGAIPYGPVTGSFAVDSHTGEYVDTYPAGVLEYNISAGPWAAHGSPDGCLWLGGDMNLDAVGNAFINSLVKHCPEVGAGAPAGPPLTQPAWDTAAPTRPASLTATTTGTNQVNLSWPAGADNDVVEYYRIYRDGTLLTAVNFTSLSYTERVPGSHTYAVTSVDRRLNESQQRVSSPLLVTGPAGDYQHLATGGDFEFGTDGFTYADDTFRNTNNAQYGDGFWVVDGTFDGGGLAVQLGAAQRNQVINGISGGFVRTFTLSQPTDVTISMAHRLEVGNGFTSTECAEVLMSVDGTLYGTGSNDYVSRLCDGGLLQYATHTARIGTLSAGTHTVRIGAYVNRKGFSTVGNSAQATFDNVYIVGSAPGAQITSPAAGATLSGTQVVSVAATDFVNGPGSLGVQVSPDNGSSWNNASWNAGTSRYEWSWNTASSGNGSRIVLARATDSNGLTTISAPVNVTIGNGAPTAVITSPAAGSTVTGTTTVRVQATDNVDPAGSLNVQVSINAGAAWNQAVWNAAQARYEWAWNSTSGPGGSQTIMARATDSNANTTNAAPVVVTVDNTVPGYTQAVAADNPTVWWRLGDQSGTVADDSVGTLDGTYSGGPALGSAGLIAGDGNTSVGFDGSNDVVLIPDSSLVNTGGRSRHSIELWFNAANVTNRQVIYEQGGTGRGLSIYVDGGSLWFGAWDTTTPWASATIFMSTPVTANATHHAVLALDGPGGRVNAYLDGVQVGSGTGAGTLGSHGSDAGIGAMNDATRFHNATANGAGFRFTGRIDEVALYNQTLSATRVAAHYLAGSGSGNAAPSVSFANPSNGATVAGTVTIQIAASDNEDAQGSLAVAVSIGGGSFQTASYNAGTGRYERTWNTSGLPDGSVTLTGRATDSSASTTTTSISVDIGSTGATFAAEVAADTPTVWWRLGDPSGTVADDNVGTLNGTYVGGPTLSAQSLVAHDSNASVSFDGFDDVVEIPDSNLVNVGGKSRHTIELWFNATNVNNRQVVYEQGGTGKGLVIYVESGSVWFGGWDNTPWPTPVIFMSAPISANTTYHAVLALDGPAGRLNAYLNGSLVGSAIGAANLGSHGSDVGIGAMNDGTRFQSGTANGDGFYFSGRIDDVVIYNQTLSAARVAAHRQAGV